MALVAKKLLLHMDGTIHEVAGIAAEAAEAERIAGAGIAGQFAQTNCLQDCKFMSMPQGSSSSSSSSSNGVGSSSEGNGAGSSGWHPPRVGGQCGRRQPRMACCAAAGVHTQQYPHI